MSRCRIMVWTRADAAASSYLGSARGGDRTVGLVLGAHRNVSRSSGRGEARSADCAVLPREVVGTGE